MSSYDLFITTEPVFCGIRFAIIVGDCLVVRVRITDLAVKEKTVTPALAQIQGFSCIVPLAKLLHIVLRVTPYNLHVIWF